MTEADRAAQRQATIKRLAGNRGRSPFLRWSGVLLLLLIAHAWTSTDFRWSDFTTESRVNNFQRFVLELAPQPLQHRQWDWHIALQWFGSVVKSKGWSAAAATLAISIVAATLAALTAALLTLPATRTLATAEPFLPGARAPSLFVRGLWTSLAVGTRLCLVFLRAIPEYIWAFLLIAVIGPTPWPAILALAIHNAGILAKLYAESIENLEPEVLASIRAVGASRRQVAVAGILPVVLPRAVLFLFYRWESCVRDATVLGMLGIASLGFYVQDARARQQFDVMLALIFIGAVIVVVGDLISAAAREAVRRSS